MISTIEQERRKRAAALVAEAKLDALLVTNLHNVRYLTGFTGSNGHVVVARDGRAWLFTDPRYTVQAGQQVNCSVVIAKGTLIARALAQIARLRLGKIGFEPDSLTVAQYEALKKDLPARASLESTKGLIGTLRAIKDAGEREKIQASVTANSRALENALNRFRRGMSESELAAEIDYRNRKLGAEGPSFDTIVAAGERSALPHAQPGAMKIDAGIVLIDMGAFRAGYASDMTRMVYAGPADAKYRRVYRAVLEAQLAAIDAVKPGVRANAIDRAARETLKKHGFEKEFVHSTGHGLGLEIHEPPRIGRKDKTPLREGMVITIEPGVYIEGWGGIRIEDTVLVTAAGCEVLTPTSKDLREI
jgi:Xaa-Pro aminopeptidase